MIHKKNIFLLVKCVFLVLQGKKKARKKADSDFINWEGERETGVRTLLQLLQLNIHMLWDPPVVDEDFVRSVTISWNMPPQINAS